LRETSSSKGKAKGASKSIKPVDGEEKLSEGTRKFHQGLVDAVPQELVDKGTWKEAIFNHIGLEGLDGTIFFEHVFEHLKDLGKSKNKRIYIGPGRDGSSDDKISIDCRFDPQNTKITYNKVWAHQGFVKTSYAYFEPSNFQVHPEWKLVEDEVNLDANIDLTVKRVAIFIHPPKRALTALVAVDPDYEWNAEPECFYCGEDTCSSPCTTCGQGLCSECIARVAGWQKKKVVIIRNAQMQHGPLKRALGLWSRVHPILG
jgi:hypothetical protein